MIQAVVLVGGGGTRLRPITRTVSKAMVPLRGKPYIRYVVDSMRAVLEGAIFSMGYLPGPIRRFFEGLDLAEVVEAHRESGALATITLTSVEDPTRYGLVEVDHQLRVKRFVEKPSGDGMQSSLINAGIYVLEREVLNMISEGREVSIEREVFPALQSMGKLRGYVSSAYWRDIGTPRSYLAASNDVLSGAIGRDHEFRYASVHPSARISKDVTLLPPVFVAEGCEVEAGATIGGRTSLGEGCLIEGGAMVEGSILFGGVRVEEGTVVRNSIVGPRAVIQGHCVVRGLSVLGAGCIVEEGNSLDGGARVNPGVRLPKEALSF